MAHSLRTLLPPKRVQSALPVVAPLVAGLVTLAWFGAPFPLNWAVPLGCAALVAALATWHQPFLVASLIPILIPLPQLIVVFAYEVALIVTAILLFLSGARAGRPHVWRLAPLELASIAFLVWGMITIFWSESWWWWLFTVRKYAVGCLGLWTAWRLAREVRLATMQTGIVLSAMLLALWTLAKALRSGLLTGGFRRAEGTDLGWGTSNFIAALLLLAVPTILHLALDSRRHWTRMLSWTTILLSAMVMSVAASRGGALLLLAAILMFAALRRFGRQTVVLLLGLVGTALLLLLGPGGSDLVARFFIPREQGSVLIRLLFFREGWRRLIEHFPWGVGFGQGYVQVDRLGSRGPHNYLLLLGSEVGLPGLILWGLVLALLVASALRLAADPARRPAARVMLLTIALGFLNSQFEGTFEGLQYQFLFFWIMGTYLGGLERPARTDPAIRSVE